MEGGYRVQSLFGARALKRDKQTGKLIDRQRERNPLRQTDRPTNKIINARVRHGLAVHIAVSMNTKSRVPYNRFTIYPNRKAKTLTAKVYPFEANSDWELLLIHILCKNKSLYFMLHGDTPVQL